MDHLLYFLLAVSVFFTVLIFGAIFYFGIRYRRRVESRGAAPGSYRLHARDPLDSDSVGLSLIMFAWGARVYFTASRPPEDALQIYGVGKQWMWKLQHHGGQREINELHVPWAARCSHHDLART